MVSRSDRFPFPTYTLIPCPAFGEVIGQSEQAMLGLPRGVMIQHIRAVTLAVELMQASVAFYLKLGFRVVYGGSHSSFTTLQSGEALVNLVSTPGHQRYWWGRVIFRIDDADVYYNRLVAAGLEPEAPQDASWGERFFHIRDPDGHEISLAQ